jgi:hypothetical protein
MARTNTHDAVDADCDSCPLVGRRKFFRDAGVMAAGVLFALGAVPGSAAAAQIEFVSALGGAREDKAYAVPAKDGAQIDKDNETIVARWQGKVYVFSLACPHQRFSLSDHRSPVF